MKSFRSEMKQRKRERERERERGSAGLSGPAKGRRDERCTRMTRRER